MKDTTFTKVDFRGVPRRVLRLEGADPQSHCYQLPVAEWVEGIGSRGHLLIPYPDCGIISEGSSSLTCVFDSTLKIYGDTVVQCFVLNQIEPELPNMKIYPNPVSDYLYFKSEEPYDTRGRMVMRAKQAAEIHFLGNLLPGIYFITGEDRDGVVYSYKFIKE